MIQTRAEAVALIRRRLEESGLSSTRFAIDVLWRSPRTVRKWLADDSPIPDIVLDKLETPKVAPWPVPTMQDVPEFDREQLVQEIAEEVAEDVRKLDLGVRSATVEQLAELLPKARRTRVEPGGRE